MEITKSTENALAQVLELGRGIGIPQMAELAEAARSAGGTLVAVEPDDDGHRCGNGHFVFKWPVPKGSLDEFLSAAVRYRIQLHILINGIPAPDELRVQATAVHAGRTI